MKSVYNDNNMVASNYGDLTGGERFNARAGDPVLQRSFRGHKDAITSVAFAPNM